MLDLAAREPATLVLGLDANAASMAEASRRAAGPARKGGRSNARFIVAAAEAPSPALRGVAGLVTVRFPWGSLLRGVVGQDKAVACGVAGLVAAGGTLELLLAPSSRDGLEGLGGWSTDSPELARHVEAAFAPHGLCVVEARPSTGDEIAASGSTWAKRLLSSGTTDRAATVIRLVRARCVTG